MGCSPSSIAQNLQQSPQGGMNGTQQGAAGGAGVGALVGGLVGGYYMNDNPAGITANGLKGGAIGALVGTVAGGAIGAVAGNKYLSEDDVNTPAGRLFNSMQGKGGAPPGSVAWSEFSQVATSVGWNQEAATHMWYNTDKDRSGVLSMQEWLVFARKPENAPQIERLANQYAPAAAPAPGVARSGPGAAYAVPATVIANPAPVAGGPGTKLFAANQGQSGAPAGAIAWTNFSALTAQVGWQQDAATQMWYDADKDRSGILCEAEFMAFAAKPGVAEYIVQMEANIGAAPPAPVAPPAPLPPPAPVALAPGAKFFAANQGQNAPAGAISWHNFSKMTMKVGWPLDQATQMWFDADKDRGGVLCEAEFMAFAAKPSVVPYIVKIEAVMS